MHFAAHLSAQHVDEVLGYLLRDIDTITRYVLIILSMLYLITLVDSYSYSFHHTTWNIFYELLSCESVLEPPSLIITGNTQPHFKQDPHKVVDLMVRKTNNNFRLSNHTK